MEKRDYWSNINLYLLDIFSTFLFIDSYPNNVLSDYNHLHYFLCAMYFHSDKISHSIKQVFCSIKKLLNHLPEIIMT